MASASIGDPQSLNLFAYTQNNPVDFVDPSGLDDETPIVDIETREPLWVWGDDAQQKFEEDSDEFNQCALFGSGCPAEETEEKDDLEDLALEFKKQLDRRNCRQKLNDLLKNLGNKDTVDDFADKFLNGTDGKKTVIGKVSSELSSAEYSNNIIRTKARGNNAESESIRRNAYANNFRHELFHAANNKKIGLSHEKIVTAMYKVDGANFKELKSQVDAQAKAASKAAKSAKEKFNQRKYKEGRYSNFMNIWLEKECGREKDEGKENG